MFANSRNLISFCKRNLSKFPGSSTLQTVRAFETMTSENEHAFGPPLNVKHDVGEKEFFIQFGKEKAYLQYSQIKPDLVDLEHTVVPVQHRGHGIGKVLAQTAFEHFVKEDTRMKLTCTYLQKFYNDNPLPQYTERVVEL